MKAASSSSQREVKTIEEDTEKVTKDIENFDIKKVEKDIENVENGIEEVQKKIAVEDK